MKGRKSVEGRRKSPYLLKDFRNEIFRKDVAYDNIKSQKKTVFGPFPRKDIFGKTIGEGQMDSTAFLGLDRSSKCALS